MSSKRRLSLTPVSQKSKKAKTRCPINWSECGSDDDETLWELIGTMANGAPLGTPDNSNLSEPRTPVKSQVVAVDEDTLTSTPTRVAKRKQTEELMKKFEGLPVEKIPPTEEIKEIKTDESVEKKSKKQGDVVSDISKNVFRTPHNRNRRPFSSRNSDRRQAFASSPLTPGRSEGSSSGRGTASSSGNRSSPVEVETDISVINRRQKQLDFGKNTVGYSNYLLMTPKAKRSKVDPRTPDKFLKFSRRSWDQQIKLWRKKLHSYDPNDGADDEELEMSVSDFLSDASFVTPGCSSPVSSAMCSSPFGASNGDIGTSEGDDEFPPLPSSEPDIFGSEANDVDELQFFAHINETEFLEGN